MGKRIDSKMVRVRAPFLYWLRFASINEGDMPFWKLLEKMAKAYCHDEEPWEKKEFAEDCRFSKGRFQRGKRSEDSGE